MKRVIFIFIFLGCIGSLAQAQITKETAISEFVQGNLSYKEGDYQRALQKYEGIIKGGRSSGFLYYNLANAYYRTGNLGKAIVNYERAKRILPRDGDLNYNYKYVLSKANLFEGKIGRDLLSLAVEGHINFYSIEEMWRIMCLILGLMGLIHLLSLYFRWPARSIRFILVVFSIVLMVFVAGLMAKSRLESDVAVILKKGDAKFEPRPQSTTHYQLQEGDKVNVLREEDGWVKIQRSDGKLGWVAEEELEKI